jgi:hypothetical protein
MTIFIQKTIFSFFLFISLGHAVQPSLQKDFETYFSLFQKPWDIPVQVTSKNFSFDDGFSVLPTHSSQKALAQNDPSLLYQRDLYEAVLVDDMLAQKNNAQFNFSLSYLLNIYRENPELRSLTFSLLLRLSARDALQKDPHFSETFGQEIVQGLVAVISYRMLARGVLPLIRPHLPQFSWSEKLSMFAKKIDITRAKFWQKRSLLAREVITVGVAATSVTLGEQALIHFYEKRLPVSPLLFALLSEQLLKLSEEWESFDKKAADLHFWQFFYTDPSQLLTRQRKMKKIHESISRHKLYRLARETEEVFQHIDLIGAAPMELIRKKRLLTYRVVTFFKILEETEYFLRFE